MRPWRTSIRHGQCFFLFPPSAEQQQQRQRGGQVSAPPSGFRRTAGDSQRTTASSCSAGCELPVSGGVDHSVHSYGPVQSDVPPGRHCYQRGMRKHQRTVKARLLCFGPDLCVCALRPVRFGSHFRLDRFCTWTYYVPTLVQVKHKKTLKNRKCLKEKGKLVKKKKKKRGLTQSSPAPCCQNGE